MIKAVIENEIHLTNQYIHSKEIEPSGDICFIGSHPLAGYLRNAVESSGYRFSAFPTYAEAKIPADCGELWYCYDPSSPAPDDLRDAAAWCERAQKALLCIIPLKNIPSHPAIMRYAEMELLSAADALHEVRSILCGRPNVKAIVLDRLIGAEFDDLGLREIIREAEEKGTVTVTQDMANRQISCLYVPDAVSAVLTVSSLGKTGNLYNANSCSMSAFDLHSKIYAMLARHGVQLNVADGDGITGHAALSSGKLNSLGWEPVCSFDDALRYTLQAYTAKFDIQANFIADSYSGKLSALRAIQLDMLREIDRICRKHQIQYFLSGGSMLGAVRHGGYIPWDDDIDVAFLREEFEKFKAVAPDELDSRFSYQSYTNQNGYHYFFDRITANDTYFASKYSDSYEMPKGISVDVFVYDAVPDSTAVQNLHWNRLMNKRLFMNVRWKNEPRGEGTSRMVSRLLLPVLRWRSMDAFSASYDKATRRYEQRSTNTVMPPATDHDHHPSMPREWFTEVVPCTFEGVDTFIPKGCDGFLKLWYGDDYMTMLPLSLQQPYHDYYRLDIGRYADEDSENHFDFLGELK
jgi:lipopolysaccharide cholinephosphotransferase